MPTVKNAPVNNGFKIHTFVLHKSHMAAIGWKKSQEAFYRIVALMQPNDQSVSRHLSLHNEFKNFWQFISNPLPMSLVCHCSNSCRQDAVVSFWTASWHCGCFCRGALPHAQNFLCASIQANLLDTWGELAFFKEASVAEDKRDFLTVLRTEKAWTEFKSMDNSFNCVCVGGCACLCVASQITHSPGFRWCFHECKRISWSY